MNEVILREFDALCLPPVEAMSHSLRTRTKVSQGVFATYLNARCATVKSWEQGNKKPNGPSIKRLKLIAKKGLEVQA